MRVACIGKPLHPSTAGDTNFDDARHLYVDVVRDKHHTYAFPECRPGRFGADTDVLAYNGLGSASKR